MTIPLRHFVVAGGLLPGGALLGAAAALGLAPGRATLAHVHLLLVGWVCVTIMGAMTQFVPVWSGVRLHSRRLATAQLWLVVVGLVGLAAGLLGGRLGWLPPAGALLVLGFWTFVYNVGRTLLTRSSYDVTERHFGLALAFFVLATAFGLLLAVDFVRPIVVALPVSRGALADAHVTLAVFGGIVTTVLGALYQLATMFTQSGLRRIDVHLRRFEEVVYPVGVVLLATGRLLGGPGLARAGGLLVATALLGVAVVLGRRLAETSVDWTPILSRYAVAALALGLWAPLAGAAWLRDPLLREVTLGAPGTAHLLAVGAIGFVVLGTLYHVVPFIVWVHRYADLLGREPVPMIDDLYDDRVAVADFGCLLGGTALIVAAEWFALGGIAFGVGGALVAIGSLLFLGNLLWVVRAHSPHSLPDILVARPGTDLDRLVAGPADANEPDQ